MRETSHRLKPAVIGHLLSGTSRLGELEIGGSDAGMTTGVLFGLGLRPAKLLP